MITVICTKWGSLFEPEYVNRLVAQVDQFLTVPHRFVCFTDDSKGIHSNVEIYSIHDLWEGRDVQGVVHGGLANLSIFSRNFPLDGRILYLDLDVIIRQNIDEMVSYAEPFNFVAIWDWWSNDWNGSVNVFNAHFRPELWEKADVHNCGQQWLLQMVPDGKPWPVDWCRSYKAHYLNGLVGPLTKILVYHGYPKPHELPTWGGL